MQKKQQGFSALEGVLIILILAILGGVGWFIYDKQQSKLDTNSNKAAQEQSNKSKTESIKEPEHQTIDSIKFTLPSGWEIVKAPYEPYETGSGHYLLSADYKEAGKGQLSIETGAYIHFDEMQSTVIISSTTVEQAADIKKSGDFAYYDKDSVKTIDVGGKQVVTYNAGHTTDGVTALHKTVGGKWLSAEFSTISGGAGYSAQDSPHYQTFLGWLEEFVNLNP